MKIKAYFNTLMLTIAIGIVASVQVTPACAADASPTPAGTMCSNAQVLNTESDVCISSPIYMDESGNIVTMDCNGHETIIEETARDIGPAIYIDGNGNIVTADGSGTEKVIGKAISDNRVNDKGVASASRPLPDVGLIINFDYSKAVTDSLDKDIATESVPPSPAASEPNLIVDMFGNVFELGTNGDENLVYSIPDDTKPVWITLDGAMSTFDDNGNVIIISHVDIADFITSGTDTCVFEIPAFSMEKGASVVDVNTVYAIENKLVLSALGKVTGLCNLDLFSEIGNGTYKAVIEEMSIVVTGKASDICGYIPCTVTENEGVVTISLG